MDLGTFIARSGRTHAELAHQLGVTRSYVTMLANGTKRPGWCVARRILLIAQGQITADEMVNEFGSEASRDTR
jgi:transcriptional regulator with XRE-family HTH domain